MLDAFLLLIALVIVLWLTIRLNRHHERAMTQLHAAFDEEVKALRAEIAGLRLTQGVQNGR